MVLLQWNGSGVRGNWQGLKEDMGHSHARPIWGRGEGQKLKYHIQSSGRSCILRSSHGMITEPPYRPCTPRRQREQPPHQQQGRGLRDPTEDTVRDAVATN